ncbi:hypothetical protein [Nocardia fusca]|uniref:hypothetical protein n=1 Tax=Nocardia fusca TaxID=941183 RepID=UPI0007A754B3|nr:hypothetical protein [Nocardia fusca]
MSAGQLERALEVSEVTVALIAAVAGVLGVVLGRIWDHRSESTRWRRDQKTACYQRVAEEYRATCEGVRTVALADRSTPEFGELVTRVRIETAGWDNAYAAVRLVGSRPVVVAAALLDAAMTELFDTVQERQLTSEQWRETRKPTDKAFANFIISVRRELRLDPVPAEYFPELDPPAPG